MNKTSILFLLLLLLIGCAHTRVSSDVTTFHVLPVKGSGTYKFLPLEGQEGSLEYETYCKKMSVKFLEQGYTLEIKDVVPDYFVIFSYGVGDGKTILGSVPLYGQVGGGFSSSSGIFSYSGGRGIYSGTTWSMPVFSQVGSIPYESQQYDRVLNIKIISAKESKEGKAKVLYEGRVKSSGSEGEIARVIPHMIESLFEDFPGESGKTKFTSIRLRD